MLNRSALLTHPTFLKLSLQLVFTVRLLALVTTALVVLIAAVRAMRYGLSHSDSPEIAKAPHTRQGALTLLSDYQSMSPRLASISDHATLSRVAPLFASTCSLRFCFSAGLLKPA